MHLIGSVGCQPKLAVQLGERSLVPRPETGSTVGATHTSSFIHQTLFPSPIYHTELLGRVHTGTQAALLFTCDFTSETHPRPEAWGCTWAFIVIHHHIKPISASLHCIICISSRIIIIGRFKLLICFVFFQRSWRAWRRPPPQARSGNIGTVHSVGFFF